MSTESTEHLTQSKHDRPRRTVLGRSVRILAASVVAAPLVYGLSAYLMTILPQDSHDKATDDLVLRIAFACMLMQLIAFIVPSAALVLVGIAAVRARCSHVAFVPAAAFLVAGAMFGVGTWLCGLYGFDPPYIPFYLGSAMQLVAMATPWLALGWTIVHVARRALRERRA